MQEYFAACELRNHDLALTISKPEFIADLLIRYRRPGIWDQVVWLLCEIGDDPDQVLSDVAIEDPWLATEIFFYVGTKNPEQLRIRLINRLLRTISIYISGDWQNIDDSKEDEVWVTIEYLGYFKDERLEGMFISILEQRDDSMGARAAFALGNMGSNKSVPLLITCLNSDYQMLVQSSLEHSEN
jgi:hypothetical protein